MADLENKEEEASADSDGSATAKDDVKNDTAGYQFGTSELASTYASADGTAANFDSKTDSDQSKADSDQSKSDSSQTKPESDAAASVTDADSARSQKITQHHVSNILDEVLEQPKLGTDKHGYKHPMVLDLILAIGLLVAMGGFTIGLINIYITHQAEQSIMQRNYRAAITVLRGAPLAGFFTMPGADPADLLNQALYLDAMERLDANGEDDAALKDLEKIQAGSRYFDIAQEILKEHAKPSDRQLEGKAEHQATPEEAQPPPKPILPPAETDATP